MSSKRERALSAAARTTQTGLHTFEDGRTRGIKAECHCRSCGQVVEVSEAERFDPIDFAKVHLLQRSGCAAVDMIDPETSALVNTLRREDMADALSSSGDSGEAEFFCGDCQNRCTLSPDTKTEYGHASDCARRGQYGPSSEGSL